MLAIKWPLSSLEHNSKAQSKAPNDGTNLLREGTSTSRAHSMQFQRTWNINLRGYNFDCDQGTGIKLFLKLCCSKVWYSYKPLINLTVWKGCNVYLQHHTVLLGPRTEGVGSFFFVILINVINTIMLFPHFYNMDLKGNWVINPISNLRPFLMLTLKEKYSIICIQVWVWQFVTYSDSQNWVNVWCFLTIHWIALNVKHI